MCLPGTAEIVRRRFEEEEGDAKVEAPRVTRRHALLAGAGAVLAATSGPAFASGTKAKRLQDLTHVYSESFPLFLGAPVQTTREVLVTVPANGFYAQKWTFWEHSGTHMDAPAHFVANGRQSPQITLRELVNVPIVVIDISQKVPLNNDALVSPDDLMRFERRHGRIPKNAVVAEYSGWESRAGSVATYQNVGTDGLQHFPGFGEEAVNWLLANRTITGIGVDTMSLDHGASATFGTHLAILRANKYGIENLKNLKEIPPRGATIYVGLIPWNQGSGGPCRVIARW